MQYNNEIDIKFKHTDGRVFTAKYGKLDKFSYGTDGYGIDRFDIQFNWGVYTNLSYGVKKDNLRLVADFMIKAMEAVGGVCSDQLIDRPLYILFDMGKRNLPVGIASLKLPHTALIFSDLFEN